MKSSSAAGMELGAPAREEAGGLQANLNLGGQAAVGAMGMQININIISFI